MIRREKRAQGYCRLKEKERAEQFRWEAHRELVLVQHLIFTEEDPQTKRSEAPKSIVHETACFLLIACSTQEQGSERRTITPIDGELPLKTCW